MTISMNIVEAPKNYARSMSALISMILTTRTFALMLQQVSQTLQELQFGYPSTSKNFMHHKAWCKILEVPYVIDKLIDLNRVHHIQTRTHLWNMCICIKICKHMPNMILIFFDKQSVSDWRWQDIWGGS